MLYALSKIVPVLMSSSYTEADTGQRMHSRWVQWRGRVFRHQRTAIG